MKNILHSKSSEYQKKNWIPVAVFLTVLIVIGLTAFFSIFFQVSTISFQKNDADINLRYSKIQKFLEGTKGVNLLFISPDFLEKSIQISFPELKTISFSKSYPKTLEVYAETYPIVAKWVYKKDGDERQFFGFVSENGFFLPKGPDESFLMFDMQLRKKELPYYARLMQPEQLLAIIDAKRLLEDITKRKMVSLSYFQNAQEIHFLDEKKVEYWIFLQNLLPEQAEKLRLVLAKENVYAKPLEYIDLRITGKVIYKPL